MFDSKMASVGLPAGEAELSSGWCDESDALALLVTVEEWNTGWVDDDRQVLPDLESIPPGPLLSVLLEFVDRERLNGFDLVRVLRARERLVSHTQAAAVADVHEIAHAAPGDAHSDPDRLVEPYEFASDELRPALALTRRAAESRMTTAFDLRERLPGVWKMLDEGVVDLVRARVIANGTSHLGWSEARQVVEQVAQRAPKLTTGQLAAWIRKLCVESEPEKARQRAQLALEDRKLWIEATVDGTAHIHLFDIDVADARAIGRRVNRHMFSLRRDGDTRSHDNLRADVAVDFLLGSDPTNSGRGLLDMRVSLSTLAELDDKAGEIPGMGPVIADVARRFAERHPRADWQATICDDHGNVLDVVATSRRPSRQISRIVNAGNPTCAFSGCRMPAEDCDFDHLLPFSQGGETSARNGGPKCRHDHILKDHGWVHQHLDGRDIWTSPLGHIYIAERAPPD